jgi:hypothetical protein
MKMSGWFARGALAAAVCYAGMAAAHHSHATLDPEDVRVLTGTVTTYGWQMPHVFLKVLAPNLEGKLVEYSIEMGNPPSMAREGWGKDTLKEGDVITWQGSHDRNKSRAYSSAAWVEKGGVRIGTDGNEEVSTVVQPSTDFSGVWTRDDPGGFKPHYLPPTDWPYTAFAKGLVDAFDESTNPALDCYDPGPPKSTILPYPHIISRPDAATVLIERDMLPTPRVVHLDRNTAPGVPSTMGHSVGWFEGDVLVVETTNFLADRWGSHTGVDSSDQKRLLERYSLIDGGMGLKAEITLTDPVYLAEPVTFEHYWKKLGDRALVQAPCTLESSQLWIEGGYQE